MMNTVRAQEEVSSFTTSRRCYHVFLSFRGEDTRKTFTDHLYAALLQAGFRTFKDDDGLERGEDIKSELEKAIGESRISVVVLSKGYASSSWCLDELVMILGRRRTSGHIVLPVFYDVDASHVRKQTGSFQEAFMRHEEKIKAETGDQRKKELEDKVGRWRAALREVADLAGMPLPNQADGHESRFIQKIIKVVGDKISRKILDIAPYPIGIRTRAKNIQLWLDNWSINVGIVAICGMGGIGKTTIAKYVFNLNYSRFEGSSFLANVREMSKQEDGLLKLQRQLLSDILKGRKEKINSVDEGIVKIKEAICCKRVLVVLDDVDKVEQLDAVLGMRDWLLPGSRIIITTRREGLLRAHEVCKVHRVEKLDHDESLELLSWHAFGKSYPIDGYMEISERVAHHCGGLPLAIKVLASSLSGKMLNVWQSQLAKLQVIPDNEILEKLRISYDSLQDDHDKSLFLHLACLFVGSDKDCTVTILDECEFYTVVGIENLVDRCLLEINGRNKLVMHQLLREMGREIVYQESPKEPRKRSILWNPKDSFKVLRENNGTSKIEGLILHMHLLKEDKSAPMVFGVNRKQRFEEFLGRPLLSNGVNSPARYLFGIFSSQPVGTAPVNSKAFAKMHNLKYLQLNHVHISGDYENFPKELRWLCWHGFDFKSIPSDFPLESLVALDMQYSSLINLWEGTKFLELLKILDLSHAHSLAKTPNFSQLPNLERLLLENCARLVEVHESVGQLEKLVLLNVKDCKNLRRLPRSIGMLKSLETLNISGCSILLAPEMGNMESLIVLHADGTGIFRSLSSVEEVKTWYSVMWSSLLEPRKNPEISLASLPGSLVRLSLSHCNLSDDAFPKDFGNLSSLQELDLSHNPICILPDCISKLAGLEVLFVPPCVSFRSFTGLQGLKSLKLQERDPVYQGRRQQGAKGGHDHTCYMSVQVSSLTERLVSCGCANLDEILGHFKLEAMGNLDSELVRTLGLSNLGTMGETKDKLLSPLLLRSQRYHDESILCAYLQGSKVPPSFELKNEGPSISFTVPSNLNFRIQGLSLCSVYGLSAITLSKDAFSSIPGHLIGNLIGTGPEISIAISNDSKSQTWGHWLKVIAVPVQDEDMVFIVYWELENQLEVGDELKISLRAREDYQVKEVGVHLVYEEDQEEKSAQSTTEEEVWQENCDRMVVPRRFSPHPMTNKVFGFSIHRGVCEYERDDFWRSFV